MRRFTFLWTIVLAGLSTAACGGGDTGGVFGYSSNNNPTAGTGGSGTSGAGQGGADASSGATTTSSSAANTSTSSGAGGGTGQGGTGTTVASSSSGQGGGPTVDPVGCSDGTREYFTDMTAQGKIAGCAGGWSIVGVTTPGSMAPACNRIAGDDSSNPNGMGCSVEDLCAEGWHVCHGAMDVAAHSATGQCDPFADPNAPQIFITRQVQDINGNCSVSPDANNITGCGVAIGGAPGSGCDPLNHRMQVQQCYPDPVWACGMNPGGSSTEANVVRKIGPERGGVLCCTDP